MTKTQLKLTENLQDFPFQFDYPLSQQTYFKIGGPAEAYLELADQDQVAKLIKFCSQNQIKVTLIGGASNLLIDDQGIKGVVLKITADRFTQINEIQIQAEAGIKMSQLVKKSLDLHLTGLEYFLGVPGNLGGAIYNNAHYLQDLIGKHVIQVETISQQGDSKTYSHQDCQFSYDHSLFQENKDIIWQVVFALKPGDTTQSQELVKKATLYRAKTQPLGIPSSGCIFQNVVNNDHLRLLFPQFADREFVPGGFLIDQAGLKNEHLNDIYVSDIHAAFLVNKGKGSSKDVLGLIDLIKKTVKDKFGVKLKEEIFYLK